MIIVCNGDVCAKGKEAFRSLTNEIIMRPNEGYDITAYKEGLEYVTFNKLAGYDEVIVANSTCFGPFYPFG